MVIIGGALFFVWKNMDSIVKSAIEKYGSMATKTSVRVSSVKIRLSSGEGSISGLTVANPAGFSSDSAFSLGKISTRINKDTVMSDVIVIDSLRISAPKVVYEFNSSGISNIDVLKKNIQQSIGGTDKKTSEDKKNGQKDKKFIIRKLIIEDGSIDLRFPSRKDKPDTINLPRIERNNIGKNKGATSAQVTKEVFSALLEEVGIAVARTGVEKTLSKGVENTLQKVLGK